MVGAAPGARRRADGRGADRDHAATPRAAGTSHASMGGDDVQRSARFRLLLAALSTVVASACADGGPATPAPTPASPPSHAPAPTPTETEPGAAPSAGEWTDRFSLTLVDGWSLSECPGDAADICVRRDGEIVGNLELAEYPLEDASADPLDVVQRHAEDFLRFFADDRARGCADFEFVADPVAEATVGGASGVKTGFRLVAGDGRVVERVITHYVVHDGALFLVNTDAYAVEGGCLDQSEVDLEFEPEVLADFEAHVDAIVAATPLPDAAGTG